MHYDEAFGSNNYPPYKDDNMWKPIHIFNDDDNNIKCLVSDNIFNH